jgi:hypothetical protein
MVLHGLLQGQLYYDSWVMTGMFFSRGIATQRAMCDSVRYRDAETAPLSLPSAVPAVHLSFRFLRTASSNLYKTCI